MQRLYGCVDKCAQIPRARAETRIVPENYQYISESATDRTMACPVRPAAARDPAPRAGLDRSYLDATTLSSGARMHAPRLARRRRRAPLAHALLDTHTHTHISEGPRAPAGAGLEPYAPRRRAHLTAAVPRGMNLYVEVLTRRLRRRRHLWPPGWRAPLRSEGVPP